MVPDGREAEPEELGAVNVFVPSRCVGGRTPYRSGAMAGLLGSVLTARFGLVAWVGGTRLAGLGAHIQGLLLLAMVPLALFGAHCLERSLRGGEACPWTCACEGRER
jgi:hypothetical protein